MTRYNRRDVMKVGLAVLAGATLPTTLTNCSGEGSPSGRLHIYNPRDGEFINSDVIRPLTMALYGDTSDITDISLYLASNLGDGELAIRTPRDAWVTSRITKSHETYLDMHLWNYFARQFNVLEGDKRHHIEWPSWRDQLTVETYPTDEGEETMIQLPGGEFTLRTEVTTENDIHSDSVSYILE